MNEETKKTGRPSAKIICDSISERGHRLTTVQVTLHRFVLAELNTHRMLSKNSASSRAIPIEKMIEMVEKYPAYPLFWGANQRGMQSAVELSSTVPTDSGITGKVFSPMEYAKQEWDIARFSAIASVRELDKIGLHKQLANRLLEPFLWHTVCISGTDWGNFFNQRCHKDAQPEMRAAAEAIRDAMLESKPSVLVQSEWHLPYINDEDWNGQSLSTMKKVSVARCARTSYLTQEGKRDIEEDVRLYERLTEGMHWSPFEHVATPYGTYDWIQVDGGQMSNYSGPFHGWTQFRKQFAEENRPVYIWPQKGE